MKQISAYGYLAKIKIQISLAYRFEVFSTMLVQALLILANSFFWRALYGGQNTVQGVDLQQMLTYSVISVLLSSIFSYEVEHEIRGRIHKGNIAMDFIKPVNVFALFLSQDIGNAVSLVFQKFIPLFLFASLFVGLPLPASPAVLPGFILSVSLSFLLVWLLGAIFGMINFWVINFGPLGVIKDMVIRLLSGSVIPMWFFPEPFVRVFRFFPFIYTYQQPLGIYIGKYTFAEAAFGIAVQAFWVAALFGLFRLMEKRAMRRLLVQGG